MRSAWLVLILAAPTAARAEEPGALRIPTATITAPSPPVTPPPVEPPRPPAGAMDPIWKLYQEAFLALANGDRETAITILGLLVTHHDGHPAANSAAQILTRLEHPAATATPATNIGAMEATRDGPATVFSRAELVVIQTIHGIVAGLELCAAAECDGVQPVGGAMLLGGGAGLGLSLLFTRDGITPGHTAALDAGAIWGGTLALNLILAAEDEIQGAGFVGLFGGQVLGMGIGQVGWMLTHASAGDVSLTSSGGLWIGYLGALIALIGSGDNGPQGNTMTVTMFTSGVVGLAGGATLAHFVPMSRGRVLIIDGGGLVGTLLGVTMTLLTELDSNSAFIPPALGLVAGLGLTTFLTRNFDAPEPPPLTFWAAPIEDGVMAGLGGRF